MLPAVNCKATKGHMAAMERLLAASSPLEISAAEEVAHENVAVKTVQREMNEADEANLLEEEDMHVFDREPLADRLPLVSCNTCKKPIKTSQYSAHAERCRSLSVSEDTVAEADGGASHKKPPRKARKKLLTAQDNAIAVGDRERLQVMDGDDAALQDPVGTSVVSLDDQVPGRAGFVNPRGQKNRGGGIDDGMPSGSHNTLLTSSELDLLCAVQLDQATRCRHSLTCKIHSESSKRAVTGRRQPYDVLLQELKASNNRLRSSKVLDSGVNPSPMTTKVYYLRHNQRMRGVLGSLFGEACGRNSSPGNSPNSLDGEQGAPSVTPPALSLDKCAFDGLQQKGSPLGSDKKGIQTQHTDSKYFLAGAPNGQFVFGKGRSPSPLLGAGAGGVSVNPPQQLPFGGVSVT